MKVAIVLTLMSFALPLTQTISPQPPGLQFLNLEVKTEMRKDVWHPSIVSQKPPEIHPTLGRGSGDATDTRATADLKDKWENRQERQVALDKVSNTREQLARNIKVPAYVFRTEVRNTTGKIIERFVWAYHLPDPSGTQNVQDSEYLCDVTIAPGQSKRLKVVSRIPRSLVVNAAAPTAPTSHQPALNDMIVNQIRFADNDTWQRPGWNSVILSQLGARKLSKGRCVQL